MVSPKWKVKNRFILLTFEGYFYIKMKEKEKLELQRKEVLQRIAKRRKSLNIAQTDLALLLDMSFRGYFKVETGKTKLDTLRLFHILETLEISPKEFFKDFK